MKIKCLIIASLCALAGFTSYGADITVNFPTRTTRETYGLQYAVQVANAAQTNVVYTVNTYQNLVLFNTLSNQVWESKLAILESYAQQRDAVEAAKVSKADVKVIIQALPSLDESKIAQIKAIVDAP